MYSLLRWTMPHAHTTSLPQPSLFRWKASMIIVVSGADCLHHLLRAHSQMLYASSAVRYHHEPPDNISCDNRDLFPVEHVHCHDASNFCQFHPDETCSTWALWELLSGFKDVCFKCYHGNIPSSIYLSILSQNNIMQLQCSTVVRSSPDERTKYPGFLHCLGATINVPWLKLRGNYFINITSSLGKVRQCIHEISGNANKLSASK